MLYPRRGGNIHAFATEADSCAVLDLLTPPYDAARGTADPFSGCSRYSKHPRRDAPIMFFHCSAGRPCTYYRVAQPAANGEPATLQVPAQHVQFKDFRALLLLYHVETYGW